MTGLLSNQKASGRLETARWGVCTYVPLRPVSLPPHGLKSGGYQLKSLGVCGSTRWLTPSKALIQLSLRYKTNDQFWFTFFHEAGHVLLHGKRAVFLDEDAPVDDLREEEANAFARDMLIASADFQRLLSQHRRSYFSAGMITQFAEEIGIAPGVVVGRLQHNNLLPKSHLNKLKQRIAV